MSQFAKLFQNGSSQAVRLPRGFRFIRLPRGFRFKGDKVRIRREGRNVVLEPLEVDPEVWLAELRSIPSDPEFMKERNQPNTPKGKIFK